VCSKPGEKEWSEGEHEAEKDVLFVADADLFVVHLHHAVESREETEEGDGSGRHHGTDASDLHVHIDLVSARLSSTV